MHDMSSDLDPTPVVARILAIPRARKPRPDYEQFLLDLAGWRLPPAGHGDPIENPRLVPSRRDVAGYVDEFLACDRPLDDHTMSLDSNGRDPDHLRIEDAEIEALERAQRRWERSAETVLLALMAGGRPPRRWAVRRWTRQLAWLGWNLRRRACQLRQSADPSESAVPGGTELFLDEPPF